VQGIKIKGFEALTRNTEHICKNVLDRAIQVAEDAATQVIRQAVEASAPRRTGQLAGSIIVWQSGGQSGGLTTIFAAKETICVNLSP
jgi:hypothetical protein